MKKLKLEELEIKSLATSLDSQGETKGGTTSGIVLTTIPCSVAASVIIASAVVITSGGSY